MKLRSLQSQLFFTVIPVSVFIYLVFCFTFYGLMHNLAEQNTRQHMLHDLNLLKGMLEKSAEGVIEIELNENKNIFFDQITHDWFYVVEVEGQKPILSASLKGQKPKFLRRGGAVSQEPQFFHQQSETGLPQLICAQALRFSNHDIQIFLGESMAANQIWLSRVFKGLLILVPLGLSVMVLSLMWVLKRSLAPWGELVEAIEKHDLQSEHSLLPRSESSVLEVDILVRAFEGLLKRIRSLREHETMLVQEISHQLKTPVAIILSSSEIALKKERSPEIYQKTLGKIQAAAQELREQLNRLISLAQFKLESSADLQTEWIDPQALCFETLKMLKPLADQKQIELHLQLEGSEQIQGSARRLRELWVILVDNAIKYSPPGSAIFLTLSCQAQKLVFEVSDRGVGIPETDLPFIFQRFFRGSHQTEQTGSGLGLSIAEQIAKEQGAQIEVHSILGEGSRFRVSFPLT